MLASAFPLPQMCLPFTDAFDVNVPVAGRNYDKAFVEQLFDDLIDKALSHDFHNRIDVHKNLEL